MSKENHGKRKRESKGNAPRGNNNETPLECKDIATSRSPKNGQVGNSKKKSKRGRRHSMENPEDPPSPLHEVIDVDDIPIHYRSTAIAIKFEVVIVFLFALCGIVELVMHNVAIGCCILAYASLLCLLVVIFFFGWWSLNTFLLVSHSIGCCSSIFVVIVVFGFLGMIDYPVDDNEMISLRRSVIGCFIVSLLAFLVFLVFGIASYIFYLDLRAERCRKSKSEDKTDVLVRFENMEAALVERKPIKETRTVEVQTVDDPAKEYLHVSDYLFTGARAKGATTAVGNNNTPVVNSTPSVPSLLDANNNHEPRYDNIPPVNHGDSQQSSQKNTSSPLMSDMPSMQKPPEAAQDTPRKPASGSVPQSKISPQKIYFNHDRDILDEILTEDEQQDATPPAIAPYNKKSKKSGKAKNDHTESITMSDVQLARLKSKKIAYPRKVIPTKRPSSVHSDHEKPSRKSHNNSPPAQENQKPSNQPPRRY